MPPRPVRSAARVGIRLDDPDVEFVARAQAGDRGAFEQLVRCHADHLYAVTRSCG